MNRGIWRGVRLQVIMLLLFSLVLGALPTTLAQTAPPQGNTPLACATPVFVNEFHYDNSGGDSGEFIEVAGPAGTDLSNWSLVLYNGNGGASYDTINLSGTLPDQDNGFGTLSFDTPGLQNGSPDGFALVNDSGGVEQFLSYEGTFTAVDGPANGMTSTDVGVDEEPPPPAGDSLQLTGTGECPEDFTWSGPSSDSPGSVNSGQSFVPSGDAAPYVTSTDPADGASGVATNANITVNFSEDVNVASGWYDIGCTLSGSHTAAESGGPQSFTLDPDNDFSDGDTCTVTIYANKVSDQDSDDPPDNMASDYVWSFIVGTPAHCASELFFSEYVEGSSYNKALEIVNDTGAAIDLATDNYWVELYRNGDPTPESPIYLSGLVTQGDVYVVCHSSAGATIQAQCDLADGSLDFNGDDALALVKDGVILDVIGRIGEDPGEYWDGGGDLRTQDRTLRRKNTVTDGDPDGSDPFESELIAEWGGYPKDTFDGLGSHTVECGEVAPYVASTTPFDGADGVATDTDIEINFNEPVNVTGSWYTIECAGSGSHAATVSGGPQSWTLNPTSNLVNCEECTVTVLAGQVNDQDDDDPPDYMAEDYAFSFTTACACGEIYELQGFGSSSPCEGNAVNITGCVIGVGADGFYVQDTAGDGEVNSSDGIYVYMYSSWENHQNLEVGYDATVVGGEVQEYYDATEVYCGFSGCGANGGDNVTKGGACTLPDPVTVQQIQTLGDHDVNRYESVEFMRVQMTIDGHVQGPTQRYASRFPHGDPELGFIYWGLQDSLPHSPRLFEYDYAGAGPVNFLSGACNKDIPDLDFGDRIQATNLAGVMGYHFDKWQLILDESQVQDIETINHPDISDSETAFATDEFGLCAFNLENLFDTVDDGDGDMGDWVPGSEAEYNRMVEKRAKAIVNDLKLCTVIGVQEVEGKEQVWNDLEAAIETIGGAGTDVEWDYWESWDLRDITVGILYDANQVTLVDSEQRQKCTTTDYGIQWSNVQPPRSYYGSDPCTGGTHPLFSRPPYVARLQVDDGPEFRIVVNHFKSKRGGEEETRPRREAQAQHNCDLAGEYAATTPNVAITGDLNDGINSSPIALLDSCSAQGKTLVNVHTAHVPKDDQYTYIWNGASGVLDYVYLTQDLDAYLKGASPMHINADFPDVDPIDSDNCPGGNCPFGLGPEDDTSRRSSDHDPLFIRLGNSPTAVKLRSFSAIPTPTGVLLTWETASEFDNVGFHIYRSTERGTLGRRVNDGLIPSQAPAEGLGGRYTWLDETAPPGATYDYILADVNGAGQETLHGPVVLGLWRAYLPVVGR